jgi:iduronate 2-sulfatase
MRFRSFGSTPGNMLLRTVLPAALALFGGGLSLAAGAAPAPRPNVLFIIADDLNPSLGAMGNRQVQTPHVDRLARRGMVFRTAYSSWASCLPSRASFLSGWQPARAPIFDWTSHHSRLGPLERAVYLPQHLKAQGYYTARLDKVFHIGKDDPRSWTLTEEPWRDGTGQFRPISTPREIATLGLESKVLRGGVFEGKVSGETGTFAALDVAEDDLFDGRTARRAVEILGERKGSDQPFFLAVGLRRPHLPWIAPKKYFDLYPPERIELPPRAADGAQAPVDEAVHRQMIAHYYASTTFMDTMVGRILDALEANGQARDTFVFLFGDQGYCLGERGAHFGKGKLWERALHVPLVVAGPGIVQGASCTEPVSLLDLYPTLVELTGMPAPATPLDGRSLRAWLTQGRDPGWRGHAVSFYGSSAGQQLMATVRTARHRYTVDAKREPVELVDLQVDPYERRNLVRDPALATERQRLHALLVAEWDAVAPKP